MTKIMRALLGATMLCAVTVPAMAVGPIQNDVSTPSRAPTYSGAVTWTPAVTTANDVLTLTGSATMVLRVKKVECSGTSTSASLAVLNLNVRSTADTGGTSTTQTDVSHDSTDVAGTGVMKAYTAVPGALGTLVGAVRSIQLPLGATASGLNVPYLWRFGNDNDKEITLRGVTQVLAITTAAALAAGTSLSCSYEWTESQS